MQWDGTKNAGFSTASKTWLPVAKNYTECNVELQKSQSTSFLKNFVKLSELRKNPTMKYGGLQIVAIDKDIMVYKREIAGVSSADVIAVVLNLGVSEKILDLNAHLSNLPSTMTMDIVSIHAKTLKSG